MDLGKSFGYIFEDEDWLTKVLVGGLISLVPILNFATMGYMVETLRNVARGAKEPLPHWGDFGNKFVKGLMVFVITLIYMAPLWLVACCVAAVASFTGEWGRSSAEVAQGVLGLALACIGALGGLYGLLFSLVAPAILTKYALTEKFSDAFALGAIFRFISQNIGNYALALIISIVAGFIAGFGIIACGIGLIFTSFWSYLVAAHAFGQVAGAAEASG